jgi:hypothetical protein
MHTRFGLWNYNARRKKNMMMMMVMTMKKKKANNESQVGYVGSITITKINGWYNLNTALTYSIMAEFWDDYRDETIMTYKEWLRQWHQLYNISNFQCIH